MAEPRQRNGIEATGDVVRTNIRRLRDQERLSTTRLAELLAAAGRPIQASGITKIESGHRRVDVDDLAAIATALGTTPCRMMSAASGAPLTVTQYESLRPAIQQATTVISDAADQEKIHPQVILDHLTETFRGYPIDGTAGEILPDSSAGKAAP